MKILEKILIDNIEYVCIQTLIIDNKNIYKICDLDGNEQKFIELKEDKIEIIKDKNILNKIEELTMPKTDVVVKINGRQ